MKIIHNLLFSIYFWANSLHTMHSHTVTVHRPISATEIRSLLRTFCRLPKGFHCCHPAYQQKAMRREQSCSFAIERTDESTTGQRKKKTAAAEAKWNFHFTFISFSLHWISSGVVFRLALSSASWRDTRWKCWWWFDYSLSILQQTEWFISVFSWQVHSSRSRHPSRNVDFGFVMLYVFCNGLTISLNVGLACQSYEKGH